MKLFVSTFLFVFLLVICAQAQENFSITHGPYLQNLSDTSVTIVWTTNQEAVSWVELAPDDSTHFYLTERPKYFSSSNGIKNVSTVHSVHIDNLKPGSRYRYRIYSKEVKEHKGFLIQYGSTAATSIHKNQLPVFRTNDKQKENISFLMVNDIHGKSVLMADLLKIGNYKKQDMIFFNGDMVNSLRSEKKMFEDFMDTAVNLFAQEIPMYYARGNHETRGEFADQFSKYFPGSNGNLFYQLRQGPVCFVLLDCGEDKPDSDIEYSDIADFAIYRSKEAEWLKNALKNSDFVNAPFKVAIIHMPPSSGDWFGMQDIAKKFMPLLNEAGIQLMLCGHLHKYEHLDPKPGFSNFPIIVNSSNTVLKAETQGNQLKIKILNAKNEVLDGIEIKGTRR